MKNNGQNSFERTTEIGAGKLSFVFQYLFKPRTVGAVMPSSKYLAEKMVAGIDFDNARCIVEYGPGTGPFTEEILKRRNKETTVILLEYNDTFCKLLQEKYHNEENLHIINSTAETIGAQLEKFGFAYVDYIVSGLPFASLPAAVSQNILKQTRRYLKNDGYFITFQYTLMKKGLIGQFFKNIEIEKEIRNLPPAYVLRCQ